MKKRIYLIAVLITLMFLWTNTSSAADKIGFFDLQTVISTSNTGKKEEAELKKFVDKKQDSIKAMENELEKMKNELLKQGSVMNTSVRKEKETSFQRKQRDYQLLVEDSQRELQVRQQEMAQRMIPDIMKVVRNIAEKGKYTLILEIKVIPFSYFDKDADITKQVIDEYNKAQNIKN